MHIYRVKNKQKRSKVSYRIEKPIVINIKRYIKFQSLPNQAFTIILNYLNKFVGQISSTQNSVIKASYLMKIFLKSSHL